MKRLLSIALTVVMIASLCAVNIEAAIDITNYPNVKNLSAATAADFAYEDGATGLSNTAWTQQTGYVDFTNSTGADDPNVFINYTATGAISATPILAVKIKANSTVANPWFYPSTNYEGLVAAGLLANPFNTTAGTDAWTMLFYTLPADTANAGQTMDNTDVAQLNGLRFGAPAAGTNGTVSIAWYGLFATEAEAYEYDAAYSAAYPSVTATERVADTVSTVDLIEHNYDLSEYTAGGKLTDATPSTVTNSLRAYWTPTLAAGNAAVYAAESDGNIYASIQVGGFFSMKTDKFYSQGSAYVYSLDVKALDLGNTNHFRGILFNYGKENNGSELCYEASKWPSTVSAEKGSWYVGNSGIGLHFIDASTLNLYAFTYGTELGSIEYRITLPEGVTLDTAGTDGAWTNVSVTDNGADKITVAVGGTVVAYINYADAGFASGSYNELYYRTLTITDAEGTVKASTAEGLMSIYKSMGLGSRTASWAFDNLVVAAPAVSSEVVIEGAIGAVSGASGSAISVPVTLSTPDATISSAHFQVSYPEDVLTFVDVTYGDIFTSVDANTSIVEAANGVISIQVYGGTDTTYEVVPANGTLLYLNFTAAEVTVDTTATLTYVSLEKGDDFCGIDGTNIVDYSASIASGTVTVTAPVVEDAPTEIAVADGATSVYFHKKKTEILVAVPTTAAGGIDVATLLASISDSDYMQITNESGTAVDSTAIVRTGYIINLVVDGTVVDSQTIAIKGDIRADGIVNTFDYKQALNVVKNSTAANQKDHVFAAIDCSNPVGTLNTFDTKIILNLVKTG